MAHSKIDNFTKEELEDIVADCWSFRELSRRLGYTSTGANNQTIRRKLSEYNISTDHFTGKPKNQIARNEDNVFIKNSTATQATLRNWYSKGNYTEYKCSICGQEPIWNGKTLTLTLDHINGDNHDDRLENLRWVCPNCDRQLSTFAGKNIKERYNSNKEKNHCVSCGAEISRGATYCRLCHNENISKNIPDIEELHTLLIQERGNFSKVGRMFGVSDNAVRKWCVKYGIPSHSSDYKN